MKNRIFIWKLSFWWWNFQNIWIGVWTTKIRRLIRVFVGHKCQKNRFHIFKPIKWWAFEPAHEKTCVTRKDSDQPVHPLGITRVLLFPSLDSPETVKGTRDQRSLWSDCADAQANLSLHWSHKSYCRFCLDWLPSNWYMNQHKNDLYFTKKFYLLECLPFDFGWSVSFWLVREMICVEK